MERSCERLTPVREAVQGRGSRADTSKLNSFHRKAAKAAEKRKGF
jgi:hypothetical protein